MLKQLTIKTANYNYLKKKTPKTQFPEVFNSNIKNNKSLKS